MAEVAAVCESLQAIEVHHRSLVSVTAVGLLKESTANKQKLGGGERGGPTTSTTSATNALISVAKQSAVTGAAAGGGAHVTSSHKPPPSAPPFFSSTTSSNVSSSSSLRVAGANAASSSRGVASVPAALALMSLGRSLAPFAHPRKSGGLASETASSAGSSKSKMPQDYRIFGEWMLDGCSELDKSANDRSVMKSVRIANRKHERERAEETHSLLWLFSLCSFSLLFSIQIRLPISQKRIWKNPMKMLHFSINPFIT